MDFVHALYKRAAELRPSLAPADQNTLGDDEVIAMLAPALASMLSAEELTRRLETVEAVASELAPTGVPLERAEVLLVLLGMSRSICRMKHRSLVETLRFLEDVGRERAQLVLTTEPNEDLVEAHFSYLSKIGDAGNN